jgi:transcription antitermination factor NusG
MERWYVLQSKPQKENLLYEQICLREVEAYYPRLRIKPVNPRSKRIKPYFPGYLFIHVDLEKVGFSGLQWMPGANRLVAYGGEPAFISDTLVQTIRRRVDEMNATSGETFQNLKPGDEVSIHSGPFAGYRAIFDAHLPGHERVRVLLQLLQDRQVCGFA